MARSAGEAPSTGFDALQTRVKGHAHAIFNRIELWLETERAQLPLWLPVGMGLGIGCWFLFPRAFMWVAVIAGGLALALLGWVLGLAWRRGMALFCAGLSIAGGCALIWAHARGVAGPVLTQPVIVQLRGTVLDTEPRVAKEQWRLILAPDAGQGLPQRVRLSLAMDQPRPAEGSRIVVRARLMPPPEALVPNGYDFRRQSWFLRVGAVGKALDPPLIISAPPPPGLRARIAAHIAEQLPGPAQGIATALATGEQGLISAADQAAMRTSGLAHLLSVSGLHITAVVGAAFLITLRLLALSPRFALHAPLVLLSAAAGALAGIGYTLLTGAEVPTIRSCIAALLVLAGLALGREALTLRLVASGAIIVLLFWPEAIIGPSFQLSFAAITAIVAWHESPVAQKLFARREESGFRRLLRQGVALLMTGLVVEAALMPIALFHFHKAGLYGALANLVAIPLTTFVIMPAEALALLFDLVGLGAPFWWITGEAIRFLLLLAHRVAAWPGATALLPSIPVGAYALLIGGGLWGMLWRHKARFWGLVPMGLAIALIVLHPRPDLLITGDGRHLAVRDDAGRWAILRPKAGEFVRQSLAERAAHQGELEGLEGAHKARCSPDACLIPLQRDGRSWRILALRSRHLIRWQTLVAACAQADIVVSARRLPRACRPLWLKIDPDLLRQTGGLAITLAPIRVEMVHPANEEHPWAVAARQGQ